MAASFGEPLVLSRHDISSKSTSPTTTLTASCSKGIKTEYATLGIQDEGINIIDLTTLQPDAAVLLGPETSFPCAPVSRTVQNERQENIRQTYSITHNARQSSHEYQLTQWSSTETLSSLEKVHGVTLKHPVLDLHAPQWMPDIVIVVYRDGRVSLYDTNQHTTMDTEAQAPPKKLISSFAFESSACGFASGQASLSDRVTLLDLHQSGNHIFLGRRFIGSQVKSTEIVQLDLPSVDIISASCSKEGCLAVLARDGTIYPFQIGSSQGGFEVSPMEPLQLQKFETSSMTVLCVGSTHVLVAGALRAEPEVAALLWDVRYSVLLAERRMPLPSTLSSVSSKQLLFRFASCTESQSLLSIQPIISPKRKAEPIGLKSITMMLPHVIPAASSLANAIGKARLGEAWLKANELEASQQFEAMDESRREVLQRIVKALRNDSIDEADKLFFDWLNEQRVAVKAAAKEEAKRQMTAFQGSTKLTNGASGKDESSESDDGRPSRQEGVTRIKHVSTQVQFGHAFLTGLLDALFRPASLKPEKYSPKIAAYLLERKLLSDSMLEGGLLKALQERNDWESIRWALRNTADIPEDSLVSLLRHAGAVEVAVPADAMEVDDLSPKPQTALSVSQVLGYIVAYPTSAPALRLALRQHLSRVEDVLPLLTVLNGWISAAGTQSATIKLGDAGRGGADARNERSLTKRGTPRLELVIHFLSCLLDATLLELLQYRPAHPVLEDIYERIEPQLAYLDSLERIRGPLEPFVQADRRLQRPKDYISSKKHKRHEMKLESHALAVDLYEREEFFV